MTKEEFMAWTNGLWTFNSEIKVAPYYDSLRDDERFAEMLRRVNLAK